MESYKWPQRNIFLQSLSVLHCLIKKRLTVFDTGLFSFPLLWPKYVQHSVNFPPFTLFLYVNNKKFSTLRSTFNFLIFHHLMLLRYCEIITKTQYKTHLKHFLLDFFTSVYYSLTLNIGLSVSTACQIHSMCLQNWWYPGCF